MHFNEIINVHESYSSNRCYVHGAVYSFGRFFYVHGHVYNVVYIGNARQAYTVYACRALAMYTTSCISHRLLNVHVKLIFAVLYVSLNDGTYTLWNGSFLHLTCRLCKAASHGWSNLVASG